jgi:hypothetical protein
MQNRNKILKYVKLTATICAVVVGLISFHNAVSAHSIDNWAAVKGIPNDVTDRAERVINETGSFKDVEGIVITPQERFSQGISNDEKEVKVWISEGNYIAAILTYKQSQQYLKMLEDGADGMLVRITNMENRSVKILGAFHRDDGKATPKQ